MVSAAQSALDALAAQSPGQRVDMDALMTEMTLDVILKTLFGAHQVTNARPVSEAIQTLSHFAISEMLKPFSWPLRMPLPAVRKVRHAQRTLEHIIQQHIQGQQANAHENGQDLLTMLRQARDPEQPDQGLSAQELHDQTMVMFQAGHETTATALTWWSGLHLARARLGRAVLLGWHCRHHLLCRPGFGPVRCSDDPSAEPARLLPAAVSRPGVRGVAVKFSHLSAWSRAARDSGLAAANAIWSCAM